jgi:hypothetical protein
MRSLQVATVFVSAIFASWSVLAADNAGQPLNRADCDKAGMHWDDNANVCASAQAGSTQVAIPKAETSAKSTGAPKPAPGMASSSKKLAKSPHKQVSTKKSSSRRTYKNQTTTAAGKPANHRPFRWLFPNANKRAGSS